MGRLFKRSLSLVCTGTLQADEPQISKCGYSIGASKYVVLFSNFGYEHRGLSPVSETEFCSPACIGRFRPQLS